jgi:DNA-binding SARP family transcriptional activator
MEFRILGSLEVADGGRALSLGARQRALLAFFLLHPNELVSSDRLIDALWGERPPETAKAALQVHISQLRKALGAERIQTRAPGYLFRLEADELDASRFESALADGRVHDAIALWRGPALADLRYEPWAQAESTRLDELRLTAVEERVETELARGRHAQLVAALEALVVEQPLRERLRGQLMLSLYRSGRQVEALAVYQETRRLLVNELGIEPGPELQELHRRILTQDPTLEPTPVPEADGPPALRDERREERKIVTVLACELGGLTSGDGEADPEDLTERLSAYQLRLRAELERFGGTVEKFIGESVIAVFGAPAAHADDPERAVRAALAIRDWISELGKELRVCIGVATGEALVRLGAQPLPGEASVVGEVVGTAARLHQARARTGVIVGEATYRATQSKIAYESLEPFELQGRAVPIWLATDTSERQAGNRPAAPFVGRENDLALLKQAYARVLRESSVQLVTLVGEPGIGKTRLAGELRALLERGPDAVLWHQGRCLAYGKGITFWALGEIVKDFAGILESDTGDEAAAKLGATVDRLAEETDRAWLRTRLAPLVGAGEEEPAEPMEAFAAWRAFMEAVAARTPLVLLVEDLHWAEPSLFEFLDYLIDRSSNVPILVLCTARPELLERHPDWDVGKRNSTTLSLSGLPDEEMARLVDALLAGMSVPAGTEAALLARAEGNPLYAEEFARMLEDVPDTRLAVPESIHATIAARLDALAPDRKALLHDAAVVGRVFWAGTLASIGRVPKEGVLEALHELTRKELIRRSRRSTVADEVEYSFWHALVRDVAYAQITRTGRVRKHMAAADWIERNLGEREYGELIGYHLEEAFRYRLELGPVSRHERDLGTRAAAFLGRAGRRAVLRGNVRGAANLLERARALLPVGDRDRLDLVLPLSQCLFEAGAYAPCQALLADALDEAAQVGDERLELHLRVQHSWLRSLWAPEGFVRESEAIGTRALRVFEEAGDELGQARAWALLAKRLRMLGCAEGIDQAWKFALEHARRAGDRGAEREALWSVASATYWGATPAEEATARLVQMLRAAADDRELQARIKRHLAALRAMQGQFVDARRLVAEARTTFEELGMRQAAAGLGFFRGPIELWAGDADAAESALRESCEALESIGDGSALTSLAPLLAEALYQQGKLAEAEQWARLSARTAASQDVEAQADWRCVHAKILARQGRFDDAEAMAREALEIAERTGEPGLKGDAYKDFAEICRLAGKQLDERDALRRALDWYEAKGNLVMAGQARASLADLDRRFMRTPSG